MNRTFGILVSAMLLIASAWAGGRVDAELENRLEQLTGETKVPVIVSFRDSVDRQPFRSVHRKQAGSLVNAMKTASEKRLRQIRPYIEPDAAGRMRSLWICNAAALEADAALIRLLARHPAVDSIRADDVVTLESPVYPAAGRGVVLSHIEAIGASLLWSRGITGSGVVVASMDTGVDFNHPDLAGRWRGGANSWKDVHGEYSAPFDYDGHGTAVMGLLLGGNASGSFIGVAPDAQWIAVKIFNDLGLAPYSRIHEAFQWLLDPDGDPNTPDAPDIVNGSWGLTGKTGQCVLEFYDDVQALRTAGIHVVFAAGNAGPNSSTSLSPANNGNSLSVGALDTAFEVASFSSRGPSACAGNLFPSITAPGTDLKTADLTAGGVFPYSYTYAHGTSYAAPLVSGSLALLVSAFPNMDAARLEEALLLAASDRGEPGPDHNYGFGSLNISDAYAFILDRLCPSDFNRDGTVDLQDVDILSSNWMNCGLPECEGDLNDDLDVNYLDLAQLGSEFGAQVCYP